MAENTVYTLVPSSNDGRFALDFAGGQDITSGLPIAVYLGDTWIQGSVEHAPDLYPNEDVQYLVNERLPRTTGGYYFIARNGGVCGLCVGMKVHLL